MIEWKALQEEYNQLIEKLAASDLDSRSRAQFQKRAAQLAEVLNIHNQLMQVEKTVSDCQQELTKGGGDLRELYAEELEIAQGDRARLEVQLEDILYPADPCDDRSVFVEIRAGAGGQEAALFGADLYKMYFNYALKKGWQASVVEESYTDLGGFKELIMHIQGRQVYKFLKFESGVHRVQRVPKTEGAGRVHTSTVTVAVLPELEDVEVTLNPSDLRIDTYRAGGAGGQHVNKTDSAVRITHIPSGLVVACQDERSQLKNKQKAMKLLQSRLFAYEKEKQAAEVSANRKQQVGTGDRAEKIRTYNFPQNRITDHRTELTLKKLDIIMQGDMDDVLNPLIDWDRQQRKENAKV